MWFRLPEGVTAISAGQQQFVGDANGYFEAPDHLEPAIRAAGAMVSGPLALAIVRPPPADPDGATVIEGPEVVPIALPTGRLVPRDV